MKEIKTLKEISLFNDDLKDEIAKERLKAEAVKDYKKWEKHPNGGNVCAYIKWKNNLTEEELKEEKA